MSLGYTGRLSCQRSTVKLNWKGVTEQLPEGMRVIFYPKSEEGRKVESYLSVEGGVVKVPPGYYDMVIYNYIRRVC